MEDRRTQLADLTAKQARREPDAPGAWPRFLVKHACWILVVTIAALAGADLLLHSQTRIYKSQATVVVQPPATQSGTQQAPDMATEKGIVSSSVVLTIAARTLKVPVAQLLNGLAVTSPGSTYLMNIAYSNPNKYTAQQRAQAIAEAYVTYRTPPKPAQENSKGKNTPAKPVVITTPTATLITPATLPTSPSSPKPSLDYAIAVLLGLSLGIGTAALRDRLSDRLRGPADLEACTATPLLALIPAFWRAGWKPARRLVMLRHAESVVADAYRSLRARIVQAAAVSGARTLVVTSAGPGGQGRGGGEPGGRAGAVRPVHRPGMRGPTVGPGAPAPRSGRHRRHHRDTRSDRRLSPTHSCPSSRCLEVLPAGPPPLDTSAVLQRPGFRAMLSVLKDRADFVVITAPPVLASADALILADLADMTLLVADARASARAQVRTAARELEPVHDKIVGCVYTGVGRRRLLWRPWTPRAAWDGIPAAAPRHDDRAGGHGPVPSHDDGGSNGPDNVRACTAAGTDRDSRHT